MILHAAGQFFDGMGHDFDAEQQFVDGNVFIGHVAHIRIPRKVAAKGHGVGHGTRIGASADGDGVCGQSGYIVVYAQKALNNFMPGGYVVYAVPAQPAYRKSS